VSPAPPDRPVTRPLAAADRGRAWLVTGPVGRGVAFVLDFAAALGRLLLRRGR
jgi:hypothetical protein